jgi:CubicO group peptidase (beta-lactamase class C family)
MRKLISMLMILTMLFNLSSIPALAHQNIPDLSEAVAESVAQWIDQGRVKGAVLSIVQNGEIKLCKGFGYADELNGITAQGDKTAFRIGSISKTFVAVAALIVAEQGLLDMEQDIAQYLPEDFPALTYPITMGQLLTHTAGFEDMVTGMAVYNISDTEPLAESVRKYKPQQVFKPGEVTSYSNYGIALAAYVIEAITGQDFSDFCQDNIFLPLGMKRTTFAFTSPDIYISKPYFPNGQETLEPYMNLYPEGSAVSTAEDMALYMQWLLDPADTRVLSSSGKEALFGKQFAMAHELEGMGYVWNRRIRNHGLYFDKKGETLHFYSRIALYPQINTGIFLSFNTYLPEKDINAIMERATELLYGPPNYEAGTGRATLDISGLYVNHWSNYTTPEKALRYIVPGKILTIEGNLSQGFTLNGEGLILIGEDMYLSSKGILKFISKGNSIVIGTESATTYSKVPAWQHPVLWFSLPVFFFIMALVCFIFVLVLLIRKKRAGSGRVYFVLTLLQLLSFLTLCVLMYRGIAAFSLLSYSLPLTLCGWAICITVLFGSVRTIYAKRKGERHILVPALWSLAGILFSVWMIWMRIL